MLGGGRLAGIDMGDDADVAHLGQIKRGHGLGPWSGLIE
jgi:hypothetical protein